MGRASSRSRSKPPLTEFLDLRNLQVQPPPTLRPGCSVFGSGSRGLLRFSGICRADCLGISRHWVAHACHSNAHIVSRTDFLASRQLNVLARYTYHTQGYRLCPALLRAWALGD
jgi:hypothetical protein